MYTTTDESSSLIAEYTTLLPLLRQQNGILQRATPEFIAATRRKIDIVLRLQSLAEGIRANARNSGNPQTWTSFALTTEIMDEPPRVTDYGSMASAQPAIAPMTQGPPNTGARTLGGWTPNAESAMWNMQHPSRNTVPPMGVALLKMPHHAIDSPNIPHEERSTTSSMNRNWERLQKHVEDEISRHDKEKERERPPPQYVSSDEDYYYERRTRQRTDKASPKRQWTEPPPPSYANEWRLKNAISAMYKLARFRPEEKEGHLWVCNATEHFVRHFGRDFRKSPLTDRNGYTRPIESPEVSYWIPDDDHPENGYMETQCPVYMDELQTLLTNLNIKQPVMIQACLPKFTECFYAYTIDAKDGPPSTLYTTAGHMDYRNPMVDPIVPQAITDALLSDERQSATDCRRSMQNNGLLRTADWIQLVSKEEYVVFKMSIRSWIFRIYESGIQTVQWDHQKLRRLPPQTPPVGATDEIILQPTALYKAFELWDQNPIPNVVRRYKDQMEIEVQPLPPRRAGISYWLTTPYRFIPASAEHQPRYLRRARDAVTMTLHETEESKYAAPRFAYRRHEDGDEYAYVSFRWKLGTDYDPEMDAANSEKYRKCRNHLETLQNRKNAVPRTPTTRMQTCSSSSAASADVQSRNESAAERPLETSNDAAATLTHSEEQPADSVVTDILKRD